MFTLNSHGGCALPTRWNTVVYLVFFFLFFRHLFFHHRYREPNVIFVSYFFHFADLPMGYRGRQIERAAGLLHGALKYRQMICRGDDLGVGAVCNTPYKYLFNSCRVPLVKVRILCFYFSFLPLFFPSPLLLFCSVLFFSSDISR